MYNIFITMFQESIIKTPSQNTNSNEIQSYNPQYKYLLKQNDLQRIQQCLQELFRQYFNSSQQITHDVFHKTILNNLQDPLKLVYIIGQTNYKIDIKQQELQNVSEFIKLKELCKQILINNQQENTHINSVKKQYINQLEQDIKSIPSSLIDHKIRKLQIQFIRNDLDTDTHEPVLSPQMKSIISEIQTNEYQGRKAKQNILQGQDIARNIKVLRRAVCGLDIFDVMRMINKGRQLKEIQLKSLPKGTKVKVILMFGLSGAGKTTLITRCLGYKMKKTRIAGISTVQPNNPNQIKSQHKNLVIGYSNRSTTRYPSIYQIPPQCLSKRMKNQKNTVYYLMDSAGLQDTAGSQVQISNRISMIQFLKQVDQLMIVAVINKKNWGTRGREIQKLAKTTSSLIKNIQQVRQSIRFVFNQFDNDFQQTFHNNVKDLYENIEQMGQTIINKNFQYFFKQLLRQSENIEQMLTVNPLTLQPSEFISEIWSDKQCITDTTSCFKYDIGSKAKQQLLQFCIRCKKQFITNYKSNNNKQSAIFYIKMLQLIDSQPKLNSNASLDLIQLKDMIEKDIQNKLQKIQNQMKQLQIMRITDKNELIKKLEILYEKYDDIGQQISKYNEIKQCEQFISKHKLILEYTLDYYKNIVTLWTNYHQQQLQAAQQKCDIWQLIDATIIGQQLCMKFCTTQQYGNYQQTLQKIQKQLINRILRQIKNYNMNNNSQIQQLFNRITTLQLIIRQQNDHTPIIQNIQSTYYNMKQQIKLISIKDNIQINCITQNLAEQIQKVEQFLQYIRVIQNYPQKLISTIIEQISNVYRQIVEIVPSQIKNKFQNIIKQTQQQQQMQEDDYQNNITTISLKDQRISQLEHLIKSLQILQQIPTINQYYDGQLTKQFEALQIIIEKSINKFDKISQTYQTEQSQSIRKNIKIMKSQLRQVDNMVKITGSQILQKKSSQLKQNLGESINTFIAINDIDQSISFRSKQTLQRNLQKLKKINQFKLAADVLGQNNDYKQTISKFGQNILKRILQPIRNLQKQLNNHNIFYPKKISDFQKYVQNLKNQKIYKFEIDTLKLILGIQANIRQNIHQIYQAKVQQPILSVKQLFDRNSLTSSQQIDHFIELLTIQLIDKVRKGLQLLSQIQQYPNIMELYFINSDHLWTDIMDSLTNFRDHISYNLDLSTWNINDLHKLKKVIYPLKSLEHRLSLRKQNLFGELNDRIIQKYQDEQQRDKQEVEKILRQANQAQNFDAELLVDIYRKISINQTEIGKKNRQKLVQYFVSYKKKVQKTLQTLKKQLTYTHNSSDQDKDPSQPIIQKNITKFLEILNTYLSNKQIVSEKIQQFRQINLEIVSADNLLKFIASKIIQYQSKEDLLYLNQSDINSRLKQFKPIEIQLEQLKSLHQIEIPLLKSFLQNQQIDCMSQFFIKVNRQRSIIANRINQGKQVGVSRQRFIQSLKSKIYKGKYKQVQQNQEQQNNEGKRTKYKKYVKGMFRRK